MTSLPYSADLLRPDLLRIAGDVDESMSKRFATDLGTFSEQRAREVVVDLSEVSFFPSIAIGVLVGAMRTLAETGRPLTVVACDDCVVARVLTLCGVPFVAEFPV